MTLLATHAAAAFLGACLLYLLLGDRYARAMAGVERQAQVNDRNARLNAQVCRDVQRRAERLGPSPYERAARLAAN